MLKPDISLLSVSNSHRLYNLYFHIEYCLVIFLMLVCSLFFRLRKGSFYVPHIFFFTQHSVSSPTHWRRDIYFIRTQHAPKTLTENFFQVRFSLFLPSFPFRFFQEWGLFWPCHGIDMEPLNIITEELSIWGAISFESWVGNLQPRTGSEAWWLSTKP